jgi:hypothetical protein
VKKTQLAKMTAQELVERFTVIAVAQDEALLGGQIAKYNRLFDQMADVSNELKARDGDQRIALMALYEYPNMQVRLKAAIHTLAVAHVLARQQLEAIADTHWMPQAGAAGMSLSNLDRGIFKPS